MTNCNLLSRYHNSKFPMFISNFICRENFSFENFQVPKLNEKVLLDSNHHAQTDWECNNDEILIRKFFILRHWHIGRFSIATFKPCYFLNRKFDRNIFLTRSYPYYTPLHLCKDAVILK